MLYTSTRSKTDSYTSHRALNENRAPDDGFFLPFRMPVLDRHQILGLKDQTFSETVAQILNIFFSTGISSWDIDCSIGKTAAKIIQMPHRVILAQLWDNPSGSYSYICNTLYQKLTGNCSATKVTDWASIAIRIAVLFGIYCQLLQFGVDYIDVSINAGDFRDPMAVWYARKMGLPVGTIVCACNDNSSPWDFLHRGELNTGVSVIKSSTPELDVSNPVGLERLVFAAFGFEETQKYLETCSKRKLYQIRPDMIDTISHGMFVSVVGKDRVEAVISSVYRSNQCILDPYTAVSYGSLQDYRAKTGESELTVLLAERTPMSFAADICESTGITAEKLSEYINRS